MSSAATLALRGVRLVELDSMVAVDSAERVALASDRVARAALLAAPRAPTRPSPRCSRTAPRGGGPSADAARLAATDALWVAMAHGPRAAHVAARLFDRAESANASGAAEVLTTHGWCAESNPFPIAA